MPRPGAPVHRRLGGVGQPVLVEDGALLARAQGRPLPAVGGGPLAAGELLDELVDGPSLPAPALLALRVGVVPGVVDLQEDPLGPAVVVGVDRGDGAPVVVPQAEAPQLALHVDHVLFGRLARVLAGLHGILLGRQPEGVVAQAVQDVLAGHPVEPRVDVGGDVAQRVADVQARAARVGEHVEDEELLAVGDLLGLGPGAGGVGGVEGPLLLPPVLPGDLDLPGQLGGVAVRRLVHLIPRVVVATAACLRELRLLTQRPFTKKPLAQEGLPR